VISAVLVCTRHKDADRMKASFDLSGRTVLVTGGTRGIGAAIGAEFEAAGAASVILTGTSVDTIEDLNDQAATAGRSTVSYVQVDFADEGSTERFLDFVRGIARIDVCINNAGVNRIVPVDAIDTETYDWLWRVNTRSAVLLTAAVAPTMKRQGCGRIVNIASIWATVAKAGRAMYSSSKFALLGLTKTAAVELAPFGVLVNAVSPGFTRTELTASTLSEFEMGQLAAAVPAGRFAEPREIAKVVLFLASDLNSYITGQNIIVDGGYVSI
jgi:3-oxoacyl-[acyl-carrier protein] reductase